MGARHCRNVRTDALGGAERRDLRDGSSRRRGGGAAVGSGAAGGLTRAERSAAGVALPSRQTVQRPLENIGRGKLVDYGRALGSAGVRGDQRALDRGSRPALVPQCDRQLGLSSEIAGKRPRRLGARAFGAIHIDGQPQHETDGLTRFGKIEQPGGIDPKALARNGLDADGKAPVGVANRDPDGLGSEIEADQNAPVRQVGRDFGERQNKGGHMRWFSMEHGAPCRRKPPAGSLRFQPGGVPLPDETRVCYRASPHSHSVRSERTTMSVDAATVRRIAHLARIAVADEEVEHLQTELNAILAFVEQLSEVDVIGVEPMTSVTPMAMKKRADVVTEGGDPASILQNAPASEDQLFLVPKVVE